MLTAHRENDQDTVKSFAQGHPTTRSFDRVVNSIDGLRERVQKFSVEQLSEVDQSLNAMSSRLAELQKTLKAIREIKDQLEQIKVQRAEAESLQQNCMAALDRAVPVQSITQVGTLLKFHRIIKLLNGANNVPIGLASVDSQSRSSPILSTPTDMASKKVIKSRETHGFSAHLAAMENTSHEGSASEDPAVANSKTSYDSDLLFHPAPPEIIKLEPALAELEQAFVLPPNVQDPPVESKATNYTVAEDSAAKVPDCADSKTSDEFETLLHSTPEPLDFGPNETFPNDSDNTDLSYDNRASIHAPEINAEFPDTSDRPGKSYAVVSDAHTEAGTNIQGPPDVDFDQRLLDDLIKNYGEFNVQHNSAGAENGQEAIDPNSASMPRVDSTATLNPASQRNLPAQRKDGELDLKLKKLIKDYGEYDLYSRQSPINLKTGVVAAFLILALAFSGFYFFSSRTSARSSNDPAASKRNTAEKTTSEKIFTNSSTGIQDAPSAPSVSNADVPTIAEVEGSRSPTSLVTPKTTK
jgi:hypothetical protein